MTQQIIKTGSLPNDGTGDSALVGGTKTNANFTELYGGPPAGTVTDASLATSSQIYAVNQTYNRTAAEISAGVTPTNYGYAPGYNLRYGIAGNGSQMATYAPLAVPIGVAGPSNSDGTNTLTSGWRLYIGNNAPSSDDSGLLISRGLSGSYTSGAHAVRDESTYASPSGSGLFGYSSFDAIPTVSGAIVWSHVHGYQARPSYTGSNLITEIAGLTSQANHSGAGTATVSYGVRVMNATGAGTITTQTAFFVDTTFNRGASNYCLYSGSTTLPSYHGGSIQMGTAPQITAAGWTTYGSIISHDATGNFLDNLNLTIINGVLTMASGTAKVLASTTNLQLSSTSGTVILNGGVTVTNGGALLLAAPNAQTGTTYTVAATDYAITVNAAATCTLTLPAAASFTGRMLIVRTIAAFTVVSATSNVVPIAGGAAGTAILAATPGKFAYLQSDGTSWQTLMAN